ncbi:MAG TPA: OmpH family outer membrane protein [Synergistaceae bacterium]|nr:OmpH family outer membrane protein [Synergistaceae bacterium]
MKQMYRMVAFSLVMAMVMTLLGSVAFAAESKIGVINPQAILANHPKFKDTQGMIQKAVEQKQNEAKIAIEAETDNNKKAEIFQKKREEAALEEKKLMDPLFKEIDLAIRTVAKAKKLDIVLDNTGVFYGGIDITNDVIQHLQKNAAK